MAGVAIVALGWLWWRAWAGFSRRDAAALCVAGVALGDIYLGFAWQAWRMVMDLLWLCAWAGFSRRDAAALCVAGVALGDIHLRFAWQAWHLIMAHGHIHLRFAWQACTW